MNAVVSLLATWCAAITFTSLLPFGPNRCSLPVALASERPTSRANFKKIDAYMLLAHSIQNRISIPADNGNINQEHLSSSSPEYDVETISAALRSLSTSQTTLKRIDGAAHEAYQRTHSSKSSLPALEDGNIGGSGLNVAGRMSRNAARVGCVADALFAAELCELISLFPPISVPFEDNAIGMRGREGSRTSENSTTMLNVFYDEEGTLAPSYGREVIFNATIYPDTNSSPDQNGQSGDALHPKRKSTQSCPAISVLVIYESTYKGGAGTNHGGVDDLLSFATEEEMEGPLKKSDANKNEPPRGRYLVILSDHCNHKAIQSSKFINSFDNYDLPSIISILDVPPQQLELRPGVTTTYDATVCGPLYQMAAKVIEKIGPLLTGSYNESLDQDYFYSNDSVILKNEDLRQELRPTSSIETFEPQEGERNYTSNLTSNTTQHESQFKPAIHFVGHSLAGGVAALAANILDGSLPMPDSSKVMKREETEDFHDDNIFADGNESALRPASRSNWCGFARARSSALCLGPPPCLSPNLKSAFVTSIIHGDDIICRTTHESLQRLFDRTRRSIQGGIIGRSVGWMTDTVSLTVSGLKSHTYGSESKAGKLAVPGKVYLVRPRRMGGGSSSIHEVGAATGGREALRAAVLWQLNDVLLSKSLWAHHYLDAYIRSLDRVQLRGVSNNSSGEGTGVVG